MSGLDHDVLSFDVAKLAQTLSKRLNAGGIRGRREHREIANPGNSFRLLRLRWKAKHKERSAYRAKCEEQSAKRKRNKSLYHEPSPAFLCSLLHAIL